MYSVFRGFKMFWSRRQRSGKSGGCDNWDCLLRANCYDQRRPSVKWPAELWLPACFETPVYLLIINAVIDWEIWLEARSWKELWKFQSAALQKGHSGAGHSGILGFAFNGDDDDDL